jgi:WD40 repeat protein
VHDLLSKGDSISTVEVTSGVKCCTLGGSRLQYHHLAYGDYSGTLAICDLERGNEKPLFSVQNAHGSIINAIDGIGGTRIGYGAPELVTGGRDGFVHVWDPRVSHSVFSLEPDNVQAARDCWAVTFGNSFNDDERCICVGFDNGDVKMYDLRTGKLKWETNVGNGITCIEFDRKDIEMNKMVVTSLESKFRYYDLRTQVRLMNRFDDPVHVSPHNSTRTFASIMLARNGWLCIPI